MSKLSQRTTARQSRLNALCRSYMVLKSIPTKGSELGRFELSAREHNADTVYNRFMRDLWRIGCREYEAYNSRPGVRLIIVKK